MNTVPPNGQLLRMLPATAEQQAAIAGLLEAMGPGAVPGMNAGEKVVSVFFLVAPGGGDSGASNHWPVVSGQVRYRFQHLGSHWEAVFDGGQRFTVPDTLGARYLDFLLHHPSQAIRALDLEVAIRADKRYARAEDSRQEIMDRQAQRELEWELAELKGERLAAEEADKATVVQRLDEEIRIVEATLRQKGSAASDSGERARNNVRKAVGAIAQRLRRGNKYQKALAAHIGQCISLGYDVIYNQPEGARWE